MLAIKNGLGASALPNTSSTYETPNRCPVRKTQERIFCAISVPSKVFWDEVHRSPVIARLFFPLLAEVAEYECASAQI